MRSIALALLLLPLAACDGATSSSSMDMSGNGNNAVGNVVINEVNPHGTSVDDPDFAELYNKGTTAVDLTGYKVRDAQLSHLPVGALPDGTTIQPGGYLLIKLIDPSDAAVPAGLVIGFQLKAKGDEFHLVGTDGRDVDSTIFDSTLPSSKSWGRLPNGVGSFLDITPSPGARN